MGGRGIFGAGAGLSMARHNPLLSGGPSLGPRAAMRMARHNPLLSGGPCLGPRAAMRMARHNPLIYQALLQATMPNSLAPPKMVPRKRLLTLGKRRILGGQLTGSNNIKCFSPLRNSKNNMPQ